MAGFGDRLGNELLFHAETSFVSLSEIMWYWTGLLTKNLGDEIFSDAKIS